MTEQNMNFLKKAHTTLMYIGGAYVLGVALLATPWFQRHAVYMHKVTWPLNPQYDNPHYHGLAPYKTANVKISTDDNVAIGGWYVLADPYYKSKARTAPPTSNEITESLSLHPTVLFFHGNAANRAINYRIQVYSQLSGRLGANVLAIDYRGFGDSEGTPSEEGLVLDAYAAWNWLLAHSADPSSIVIMGQSLGTGVSSALAAKLSKTDVTPKALALIAPFSSIPKLLETFNFGGFLPVLRPLQMFPLVTNLVNRFIHAKYQTIDVLPMVKCPILLVHSTDDMTIPSSHSSDLFEKLMEPHLPPLPYQDQERFSPLKLTADQLEEIRIASKKRSNKYQELTRESEISGGDIPFGTVREFERSGDQGKVVWFEAHVGGHTDIVRYEGTIDLVGMIAGISR